MADLSDLENAIRRRAVEIVEDAARRVVEETATAAPVGDEGGGALRDSHRRGDIVETGNVISTEVIADAPHAIFVAENTRPHPIRPVRAKVLRFTIAGQTIFTTYVNHPGTTGQPEWWSEQAIGDRWRAALEAAVS